MFVPTGFFRLNESAIQSGKECNDAENALNQRREGSVHPDSEQLTECRMATQPEIKGHQQHPAAIAANSSARTGVAQKMYFTNDAPIAFCFAC